MKSTLLIVTLIFLFLGLKAQTVIATSFNLSGTSVVGINTRIGADSLVNTKLVTTSALYDALRNNIPTTTVFIGPGLTGTGTSTNRWRLDYSNVIRKVTSTELLALPKEEGVPFYNKSTKTMMYWNGYTFKQF